MNLIEKARDYAHRAHDSIGQVRKYTGEPYWVHTDEVASIVESVTTDESMIAAAHLHDVLEDVPVDYVDDPFSSADLRREFGHKVYELVRDLTDVYVSQLLPGKNRAERKELERLRLYRISPEAKTIKLADLLSNTASITAHDPDFAKVYLEEKRLLLPMLVDGNKVLWNAALQQITP